jgi:ferritin-like metal-binding protein YciE
MDQGLAADTRSLFVTGLRNAHAMENEALSIMTPQLERIRNYPQVADRLRQHIDETHAQIGRLDRLLQSMRESTSALKDTALSIMGSVAALGHTPASDEILKNSLANFAFENYEIAAYKSLLAMAELGAEGEATELLRQSLAEEQAMARWLDENIGPITLQYARLHASGVEAKR